MDYQVGFRLNTSGTAEVVTDFEAVGKGAGLVEDRLGSITGIAGGLTKALGALGLGLSAAAFTGWAGGVLDAAGALNDMSIQTGASVESLSRFQEIGRTTNTSAETIAQSMGRLAKNTALVDDEGKVAAIAINALGISFDEFKKLSPDQQMLAAAKALNEYEDGADKAAVVMSLLGKEGARLLPFLKDLAENSDTAARFTTAQAAAADELGDKLTILRESVQGAAAGVLMLLVPALIKMLDLIGPASQVVAAYFALFVGVPAIASLAVAGFNSMALAMYGGATAATALTASMTATVAITKAAIVEAGLLKAAASLLIAAFAGWEIGKWMRDNFLEAQLAGIAFVEGTMVGWESLKYGAAVAWAGVKGAALGALDGIANVFTTTVRMVGESMQVLGAKDAGAEVIALAGRMKTATTSSYDMGQEIKRLGGELAAGKAQVRNITGAMADEAIAHFNVTDAAGKNKKAAGELAKAVSEGTAAMKEDGEAKKAAAKAAEKLAEAYTELISGIKLKTASARAEQDGSEKLNDAEKERLKVYSEFSGKYAGFTAQQKAAIAAALDEWSAELKLADAKKQALVTYNEELKVRGAVTAEVLRSADAIDAELSRQVEHNATLGLSKEALGRLGVAKIDDALATAEQALQSAILRKADGELLVTYADQVQALRNLKKAKEEGLTKELAIETASEWQKTTDSMYDGIIDSIYRGAEEGKGIFESLGNTLKGMFRNLVLTPTIKAVMGSAAGTLASGLANATGMTMPSAGAGGGGDGLGQLASMAGSLFGAGGLGGSLAAGAGWLTGATTLTGSLTAAGSLIGTGTMGGVASGLGMAAGALGPIAIGVALAATLLSKKRGGPKDSGSAGIGDAYRYADSGGLDEMLQGVLDGTNASYAQTAAALGVDAKTIAGTQFGLFAARDPQGTALTQLVAESKVNGQQTYFRNGENVGRSDADLEKAIADSTANAVLASLQASGIDQDARAYLESKAALGGSADQINKLLTTLVDVKTAFADIDTLGGVFGRISVLSIDAKAQLLAFSGGVEAFLEKTRAYVDQYFSEAEKAAITAQDVLTRLEAAGISTDLTTKDSLRALVESTDETTESGRQQLAVLLDVADEFASISDYLASQGKTLDELAALAPKSDLIAKLTDEGNSATKDTAEGVMDLGATTQAVGDALQSSIVTLDSNSDTRNAQLVAAIDAQSARLEELVDVQMVSSAQQVSGLTNLRKSFEDLTVGVLRVQVID